MFVTPQPKMNNKLMPGYWPNVTFISHNIKFKANQMVIHIMPSLMS